MLDLGSAALLYETHQNVTKKQCRTFASTQAGHFMHPAGLLERQQSGRAQHTAAVAAGVAAASASKYKMHSAARR
jgi:hypothetical protein